MPVLPMCHGSRINRIKLYRFESHDAGVNLAKEEYLFESLPADELIIVFYVNRSAVIIGRNQNPWLECPAATRGEHPLFFRRLSGGGAVYHDTGNLNISMMGAGASDGEVFTALILQFLVSQGFAAKAGSGGDILLDGAKISGRASYHRGTRSLHHATLLVHADLAMMEHWLRPSNAVRIATRAMASRRGKTTNLSRFRTDIRVDRVIDAFAAFWKARFSSGFSVDEAGDPLTFEQYASCFAARAAWQWRFGRTPFFTCTLPPGEDGVIREFAVQNGVVTAGSPPAGSRFAWPWCVQGEPQ